MGGRLDDAPRVQPDDRDEWRAWLQEHHASERGAWVVTFTRRSGRQTLAYEDLVDEALCFGWIDGTERRLDDQRTMLYMAPRRPGGTWARSNKDRVERLLAQGRMRPAGLAAVERAKADGSWTALDAVEAVQVPDDLAAALAADPAAATGFERLTASAKKQVLWWVVSAKREETRRRRVAEAVRRAVEGTLP